MTPDKMTRKQRLSCLAAAYDAQGKTRTMARKASDGMTADWQRVLAGVARQATALQDVIRDAIQSEMYSND